MHRGPIENVEDILGKLIGLQIFTGLTIHAKTPRNTCDFQCNTGPDRRIISGCGTRRARFRHLPAHLVFHGDHQRVAALGNVRLQIQADRARDVALRIETFAGIGGGRGLGEHLLARFAQDGQSVFHRVVVLIAILIARHIEARPQRLTRMIHGGIEWRSVGLVFDEAQIARRQRGAGLDRMAPHLEIQLRRQLGLGHFIPRRDFDVISAAGSKRRNIEMLQKLRVPILVLRRDRLGDFAAALAHQRNTGGIGHLDLPGKLDAALLVSRDRGLITGQAAAEEHGFAGQEHVIRRQHRSVFELMQRDALHRKRRGSRHRRGHASATASQPRRIIWAQARACLCRYPCPCATEFPPIQISPIPARPHR